MSNDPRRADERESFFLMSTLRLPSGEQCIKVRNLSASGALIDGIKLGSAGDRGWMDIRNLGDVPCSIVWAGDGRAGLRFDRVIDPHVVRNPSAPVEPEAEASATPETAGLGSTTARPFYTVRWMKGATVVTETQFERLLDAKAHAKDRLAINRIRKGVTAAEVCDIEGVAYFCFEA
jgi:hypothetical protein